MLEKSDGSKALYYDLPEGVMTLEDLIESRRMNAQIAEVFKLCYTYGLPTDTSCDLPNNAKSLQDLISYRNMNGQIAEIFKSCYRYGLVEHSDMLRDAKKIRYYADAEIERLQRGDSN